MIDAAWTRLRNGRPSLLRSCPEYVNMRAPSGGCALRALYPTEGMAAWPSLDLSAILSGGALGRNMSFAEAAAQLGPSQKRAWLALLDRLERGGARSPPPQLLVLGGSHTAGAECHDGSLRAAACAYPKRFADAVGVVHGTPMHWVSLATGGVTTAAILPMLPAMLAPYASWGGPSMLLIDFSVNDAFEVGTIAGAMEELLRYLLSTPPWDST